MRDRWRRVRALVASPPDFAVRIGFNGVAQLAPVIVLLALTPLLLSRLGLDFYEAHWYDYMNGGDWCAR